jgi:hypothetical protein
LYCQVAKKDKNEELQTVEYRATTSDDANIQTVSYTDADGNPKTVPVLNLKKWSSGDLLIPRSVTPLKITATGPGAADTSTLKIQIFVDGSLRKEEIKKGVNNQGQLTLEMSY